MKTIEALKAAIDALDAVTGELYGPVPKPVQKKAGKALTAIFALVKQIEQADPVALAKTVLADAKSKEDNL